MAELSPRRTLINTIAGLLMLGGIAWAIWRWYGSADRVRHACEAIAPS